MKDTYKDDATLVELQSVLEWNAGVALREIASDRGCLERLDDLALERELLREELAANEATLSSRTAGLRERLVPAAAAFLLLQLMPGSVGGKAGIIAALVVATLVGFLVPRRPRGPRCGPAGASLRRPGAALSVLGCLWTRGRCPRPLTHGSVQCQGLLHGIWGRLRWRRFRGGGRSALLPHNSTGARQKRRARAFYWPSSGPARLHRRGI